MQLIEVILIVITTCLVQTIFGKPLSFSQKSTENQPVRNPESGKSLLFPGNVETNLQLSFRIDNERGLSDQKNSRYRFYKNPAKLTAPTHDAISFPSEFSTSTSLLGSEETNGSPKRSSDQVEVVPVKPESVARIGYETFLVNNKDDIESLEALAFVIRQLLLQAPAKPNERVDMNYLHLTQAAPTTVKEETDFEVQEQSLYAGPKLRPENTGKACPTGTIKTRNGSCQKPSRKLMSS